MNNETLHPSTHTHTHTHTLSLSLTHTHSLTFPMTSPSSLLLLPHRVQIGKQVPNANIYVNIYVNIDVNMNMNVIMIMNMNMNVSVIMIRHLFSQSSIAWRISDSHVGNSQGYDHAPSADPRADTWHWQIPCHQPEMSWWFPWQSWDFTRTAQCIWSCNTQLNIILYKHATWFPQRMWNRILSSLISLYLISYYMSP